MTPISNLHANNESKAIRGHTQQNQLTINSLPPEVLCDIFLPVAGFYLGHYTRLLPLRVVCKYWKEVIDSTPGLWMAIKLELHPELQAMILRNSRNHPLNVLWDETTWNNDPAKKAKIAAFSTLMEPSASRWQSLNYRRGLTSESDIWILALPLHNVQVIEIDAPSWSYRCHTLDAPKLSYVNVTRFYLNWRSLSGLQVLILNLTNPTLNELMAMLQASPELNHLSLENTWLQVESEDQAPTPSKVFLPHLTCLRISRASTQSICLLLDSMETSNLQGFAVAVQYHVEPEDCTPLCKSAARYIGAFPLPQDNEQALVLIRVWRREIEFGLRRRRIAIRNDTWDHGNGPQDRLAYLASVTNYMDSRACREVKILDLSCREHEEIGGYLRTIHSRFPQINQILLKEKQNDIAVAFQHLSSPLQLELAEEWLLPKLTKLELDLGSSTDARLIDIVAQLVMKRKAADG
ncbi:hypothetical protein M407DRAFT_34795, partial [Tulasnella calospora MUT 4182]